MRWIGAFVSWNRRTRGASHAMRLLAALALLGLAALMLVGSISDGMKRPTAPRIEFRPQPKRAPLQRMPGVRRALACEPPLAAWEVETCT
jgi:hypothetical protein